MYSLFESGKQEQWAHPVYEKLVPSKCDQKYGAVSKASDRIHLNGAVFNEIPVQNGNADHLTMSNEHRKTTNNEEHGILYHSKADV